MPKPLSDSMRLPCFYINGFVPDSDMHECPLEEALFTPELSIEREVLTAHAHSGL